MNFDKLNKETSDYNNGITRSISWTDYAKTSASNSKSGHYLGNGQYVED